MESRMIQELIKGCLETLYMVGVTTLVAYLIGMPLGVILCVTDKNGICPLRPVNLLLGVIINILRSVPFLILLVAVMPFTRAIVGKTYGSGATIVPLVIAAAPFVARMVESSLKEVDAGVIEAAESMGSSRLQIIWKVLLPEAKPSLIVGGAIGITTILGYSAMAGTIGGGGLGQIAITFGYQRSNDDVIWLCVIITILIVQVIQEVGMRIARRCDKRLSK